MKQIYKRLFPLYVAAFLQSFVLWYAIEKLYMSHIGFNDAGIGGMVAAYSVVMLLTETPAGIWADRWSRKGVLIVGSGMLMVSSLLGGLATEPVLYLISSMCWGAFYSLYTGMYDTIVYDVLVEETGSADDFEKVYGRVGVYESTALVASALLGGLVGQWLSLPAVYLVTIPIAALSAVALWLFKEPKLHRQHEHMTITAHVRELFTLFVRSRSILWTVASIVLVLLIGEIVFEFSQLWLIALAVPAFLFGPSFAAVLSATGIGSWLAGHVSTHRHAAMRVLLGIMLASCFALIFNRTVAIIIAAQVALAVCAIAMHVFYTRDLHDLLPAKFRGGASSAAGTVQRVLLIPMALGFGALSTGVNVFTAAWIGVGLCVLIAACEFRPRKLPA